jgi:hypothetical protein
MTDTPAPHNEGIQAQTVQADVMAVGRGASASKHVESVDGTALQQAVADLRTAVAQLMLAAPAKQALDEDVNEIERAVGPPAPNRDKAAQHLEKLGGKLKMVGQVMDQVAALRDPAMRIADLLQLPLHFLTG